MLPFRMAMFPKLIISKQLRNTADLQLTRYTNSFFAFIELRNFLGTQKFSKKISGLICMLTFAWRTRLWYKYLLSIETKYLSDTFQTVYDRNHHLQSTTHVKISQLVTSLQTSRQQDVFALLVPKLSTSCSKLVDNL